MNITANEYIEMIEKEARTRAERQEMRAKIKGARSEYKATKRNLLRNFNEDSAKTMQKQESAYKDSLASAKLKRFNAVRQAKTASDIDYILNKSAELHIDSPSDLKPFIRTNKLRGIGIGAGATAATIGGVALAKRIKKKRQEKAAFAVEYVLEKTAEIDPAVTGWGGAAVSGLAHNLAILKKRKGILAENKGLRSAKKSIKKQPKSEERSEQLNQIKAMRKQNNKKLRKQDLINALITTGGGLAGYGAGKFGPSLVNKIKK